MKTITVFCSASDVDEKYVTVAKTLGKRMVEHGYDLVWGGSEMGLMKVVADSVQEHGGKIHGISVEFLHDKARTNADSMYIAADLSERKKLLLEKGTAIVLLVGGVGSLDEVAEIIELKKQRHHDKPVVVINTNNYYEGLKLQLSRMYEEGFINRPLDELVSFVDTPEEAIQYISANLTKD